ncbi:aspartic peptidase domain-containing protein [Tricharina praecox]|uniref:aspartic peptidase domain-containing protein n=1 Tax=Tricharina praecox TaxID=43433 RepID=UPI0022207443|nr:aspartic peptidase domain-containing protein [Tricharina praecox]KAI5849938.1 aspartic peptidase domain-containing protein [Tricharina praecox]
MSSSVLPNGLLHLLLLSCALPAFAAIKAKPVMLPLSKQYGIGPGGIWYSTPLTVGSTNVNLTLSTSLQHSWIPGAELCSSASNETACREPLGGEFPSTIDGVDSGIAKELGEIYPESKLLPAQDKDSQSPLSLSGKGKVSKQKITVKSSNAGSFDLGEDLTIGVFTTEKPNFNGYLSLPQISSELFKAGATPGNNFHMWLGPSVESNESSIPAENSIRKEHLLIFGGYDGSAFDLNQTQQYRLGEDGKIQTELEDLIYRWTDTGETDNSLLEDSHAVVIDTTTPYLWLPQKSVDKLVTMAGATWNDSMDAYSFTTCFSDCTVEEDNSRSASLDLILITGQKISISFLDFFRVQTGWWIYGSNYNLPVLPVRALKDDNEPIVLGRAVMAALHLWVDYDEEYFGIKAVNRTEYTYAKTQIVSWGSDHAPITNTSILAAARTTSNSSPSSTSTSTSTSSNSDDKGGVPITLIAAATGGAAVAAVLGGILACILLRRRREKKRLANLAPTNRYSRQELPTDRIPATTTTTGPPTQFASELPQAGEYYQLHELDSKVTLPYQAHMSPAPGYKMPTGHGHGHGHAEAYPAGPDYKPPAQEPYYGGYHPQGAQPMPMHQVSIHEMPAQTWR